MYGFLSIIPSRNFFENVIPTKKYCYQKYVVKGQKKQY